MLYRCCVSKPSLGFVWLHVKPVRGLFYGSYDDGTFLWNCKWVKERVEAAVDRSVWVSLAAATFCLFHSRLVWMFIV